MGDTQRSWLGRGLLLLGMAGIMLNTILLGLGWDAFEDRSNTQCAVLLAGVGAVVLGGWALRRARSALTAAVTAVLLAALFLFAAAGFAWLRSGYFFPARSRWLLRASLAVLLVSAAALGAAALRRRLSRPPRGSGGS